MQPSSYVPSFYFYKLADAISAPYTSLDAYRAGAIDSNGNLLKPVSSIDAFEFLVIKLKQIFDQLPYGTTKAKLSNYLATLNLFSEEVESYEITQEQFHCLVEGIVCHNTNNEVSYLELLEDMGTGGGAGALGVPAQGGNINQGGVSGYDIKMKLPLLKRKKGDYFDDCEIFDVCPEEFSSFMNSKQWKDVPDSETKNYLRRFQRRNKNGKVGVRGLNPVSGEQDLFWITYPAKNFMEEVDLLPVAYLLKEESEFVFNDSHKNKINTAITNMFNIGASDSDPNLSILKSASSGGHHAELQARLLSLGHGLDNITGVQDSKKRDSAIDSFLDQHVLGSTKSPSDPDRPGGKKKENKLPDLFLFDPDTQTTIGSEVKTHKAAGAFPTKWPSFGKKLRRKEWKAQGVEEQDLEPTSQKGRYRIKLPPEVAGELSLEAAKGLVRYGTKSGNKTVIRSESGSYHIFDTQDVMEHWANSIGFPSVKSRSRGKKVEQAKPETAGHSIELTPLTGLIAKAKKGQIKHSRLTMSKKALDLIKSAVDPSLHEHLDRLINPHLVTS